MIQGKHANSSLNGAEQVKLMQDIVTLLESPEHSKTFTLTLIEPDRYNPVRISVPVGMNQEAKMLVTFPTYPAVTSPVVEPRGGELSMIVASMVKTRLLVYTSSSTRLQDVVALVEEVS